MTEATSPPQTSVPGAPPPAPAPAPAEAPPAEPNTAEAATVGPDPQVSQTAYVTWTKPDGSTFVAPLSNSATYEAKGFSKGAEVEIPDIVAWNAENAAGGTTLPTDEPAEEQTSG